jgi:hypothetical protein
MSKYDVFVLSRLDPCYYEGATIPRGAALNEQDGLYYLGDNNGIPKDASIINKLI